MPTEKSDQKPRVLFVDDEPMVLKGFQIHLREKFDVVTAESGLEGLQTLEREATFDVIVSDMRMPGMNGAEFLHQACDAYPDTVRILLTGYADADSAIRAVNDGRIFRFLTKPCRPPDLIAAISDALMERRKLTADRSLLRTEANRVTSKIIQSEKLARLGSLAESAGHELANLAAIHRSMVNATIARAASGAFVSADDLADLRWLEQSLERHARQLIDFSEAESINPELVDVRDATARTLELLQVTGRLKHTPIDFDFADDVPCVHAAPGRVRHAILNLLVNALDSTEKKDSHEAKIVVSVFHDSKEDMVVCEVSDNGEGVHPEARPFLFKPYFSTKKENAGLGLSVASQIATSYGGEVDFESRYGQGARFKLRLPASDESGDERTPPQRGGVLEEHALK